MKISNRKFLMLMILNILLLSITSITYAGISCNRYIRNHSSATWIFTFVPDSGNVHFLDSSCSDNGPCSIPGGATIGIEYTSSGGGIKGTVYIQDDLGNTHSFSYANLIVNPVAIECPYVEHDGDTGSVSVNDSSHGDFTVDRGRTHW